jgi:hypothetical protein
VESKQGNLQAGVLEEVSFCCASWLQFIFIIFVSELAPIFLQKTKSTPQPSPLAAATRKIFQSAPLPPIRVAPTEHFIGL